MVRCGLVCNYRHTYPWWFVVGQCVVIDKHPHDGLL